MTAHKHAALMLQRHNERLAYEIYKAFSIFLVIFISESFTDYGGSFISNKVITYRAAFYFLVKWPHYIVADTFSFKVFCF